MAKISGSEIRPGSVIEHDGGLWVAVKTNTVKPGKGGAYNQVELKNLINGSKLNERFRSAETVEQVDLEYKDFSFLYEQGEALVFMDTESYEQLELQKDFVGERAMQYFRRRLDQADRDADFALAYVKRCAATPELQASVIDAVRFKCNVLWAQLDALHHAYVLGGGIPITSYPR